MGFLLWYWISKLVSFDTQQISHNRKSIFIEYQQNHDYMANGYVPIRDVVNQIICVNFTHKSYPARLTDLRQTATSVQWGQVCEFICGHILFLWVN